MNNFICQHTLILCIGLFALHVPKAEAQPNGPWNAPLLMAWSTDGRLFAASTIYQDSSGVPSAIRWKGDTLVAVFQWFRVPRNTSTWDRVAVKYSYDAGLTWTEPVPSPFDPTLVLVDGG